MGSVITDDTVEPLAYAVCNTDGADGLTWAEVEKCEVSKNKFKDLVFKHLAHEKIKSYLNDAHCCLFKTIVSKTHKNYEFVLVREENVNFLFKVSHQFIFRISLFGESDEKRKNQLSCLFTF